MAITVTDIAGLFGIDVDKCVELLDSYGIHVANPTTPLTTKQQEKLNGFIQKLRSGQDNSISITKSSFSSGNVNTFYTKIAGVTYDNRQHLISKLKKDNFLLLKREYNNKHDCNAICVLYEGEIIGYLNREVAATLAKEMDNGKKYICKIIDITGSEYNNYGVNVNISLCNTKLICPKCNNVFLAPNDKLTSFLCPICRTPYTEQNSAISDDNSFYDDVDNYYVYDDDGHALPYDIHEEIYGVNNHLSDYNNYNYDIYDEKESDIKEKEQFNHYIAQAGKSLFNISNINAKNCMQFIGVFGGSAIVYKDMIYSITYDRCDKYSSGKEIKINRTSLDGCEKLVICRFEGQPNSFAIINDWIYVTVYTSNGKSRLCRVTIDGKGFQDLRENFGTDVSAFAYIMDEYLIYRLQDGLYVAKNDGTNKRLISTDVGCVEYTNGTELFWIGEFNKKLCIYKSCLDGSERQVLVYNQNKSIEKFKVTDKWICYNLDRDTELYRYDILEDKSEIIKEIHIIYGSYLCKDSNIYFIDPNYALYVYDLNNYTLKKVSNEKVYEFYIYNEVMLIRKDPEKDQCRFALIDLNGKVIHKIGEYLT